MNLCLIPKCFLNICRKTDNAAVYKKVVADDGELESLYIEQEISHNN